MAEPRALLLTDVVDSTALIETLGDEAAAEVWAQHDHLARSLLPGHHGLEIDKTDGMLLLFERACDALAYAGAYHAALAAMRPQLAARAGLHVGAVVLRHNGAEEVARGAKPIEVDGIAKPTTARVMSLACGGQTLLTPEALLAVRSELTDSQAPPPRVVSHGHWRLKGVAEPIELFELCEPGQAPHPAPADGDKGWRVARVGERWLSVREVPNNLPQPANTFLGRAHELDEIKAMVRQARLVTLLGMGGLGKSRLALQAAAELLAEYPDGAWFLDLAPLREPARVAGEAARLLGVQEEPGRPLLQTLCARLRDKRLLLVVDNCEHLLDASAALAHELLRACPGVALLATSRSVLQVDGESVFAVQPLPPPPDGADLAALAATTAVRLFVERAQAQRPDFRLDAREAPQVAQLVRRLEGIPLALELAAARVRSLSVAEIDARLDHRYKLLTGGGRALQPRQQTLRALVDWSYELLEPDEQTLLQRLAVFAGGFDLAAVEAVCGDPPLDPDDLLDGLDALVAKSMVIARAHGGGTRYRMLETLREYAREKLEGGGDEAVRDVEARHRAHFWVFARQLREGLKGQEQADWAQRGDVELDNLRSAMATARDGGADPLLSAKLAVALTGFWIMRGRLSEGLERLRATLALPEVQASDMAHAHVLYASAAVAISQGDAASARPLLQQCLALRRALGDERETAATLSTLSLALLSDGHAAEAQEAEREALAMFRAQGNRVGEAIARVHLAQAALHRQDWQEAVGHASASAALARELSNGEIEGECEWLLGEAAQAHGDRAEARAHLQRSLQLCREAGDRSGEARAVGVLGRHAVQDGDLEAARAQMGDALRACRSYGLRRELLVGLEDHAELAAALGEPEVALRLLAAAERAFGAMGAVRMPHRQAHVDALTSGLLEQLGEAAFDRAWAEGGAQPLGDAVEAALALAPARA